VSSFENFLFFLKMTPFSGKDLSIPSPFPFDALPGWHSFYLVISSESALLAGLCFHFAWPLPWLA